MEPIREALDEFIESEGLKRRIDRTRLRENWSEVVGDRLARHLTVVRFQNGDLWLAASDPSWSQEASMLRERIRDTINDYFGYHLVSSIRIHN